MDRASHLPAVLRLGVRYDIVQFGEMNRCVGEFLPLRLQCSENHSILLRTRICS
jgi:hypothetical protein